jgi:hypothetical protein
MFALQSFCSKVAKIDQKRLSLAGFALANHSGRSAFSPKFSPPKFVAVKPQLFPSCLLLPVPVSEIQNIPIGVLLNESQRWRFHA